VAETKDQELKRRARELRAHPEFRQHVAKISDEELFAWSEELHANGLEANAEARFFIGRDDDEDDEAGAKADKAAILFAAIVDELEARTRRDGASV
jgi:hypothetical protein